MPLSISLFNQHSESVILLWIVFAASVCVPAGISTENTASVYDLRAPGPVPSGIVRYLNRLETETSAPLFHRQRAESLLRAGEASLRNSHNRAGCNKYHPQS